MFAFLYLKLQCTYVRKKNERTEAAVKSRWPSTISLPRTSFDMYNIACMHKCINRVLMKHAKAWRDTKMHKEKKKIIYPMYTLIRRIYVLVLYFYKHYMCKMWVGENSIRQYHKNKYWSIHSKVNIYIRNRVCLVAYNPTLI